jgi:hypothetical protein
VLVFLHKPCENTKKYGVGQHIAMSFSTLTMREVGATTLKIEKFVLIPENRTSEGCIFLELNNQNGLWPFVISTK